MTSAPVQTTVYLLSQAPVRSRRRGDIHNESGFDNFRTAPRSGERGGGSACFRACRPVPARSHTGASDSGFGRGVLATPPEGGPARILGRTGPPSVGTGGSEERRCRNRPLPRDAPGKGAAGRFPDGR